MRPSLELYFPCTTVTPLTITASVKAMDSQRWVCRIHLFQFNEASSQFLRCLRPVGRFNTEQLCVFCIEPLPADELRGIGADHASNGGSFEEVIQNVDTNVPPGSTHRDEAAIDIGPQR